MNVLTKFDKPDFLASIVIIRRGGDFKLITASSWMVFLDFLIGGKFLRRILQGFIV